MGEIKAGANDRYFGACVNMTDGENSAQIDRDKRSLSDVLQQSLAADQPEKKVGRGVSG